MSILFSPITIGGVSLKNRIVMSPMGMNACKAEDGKVTNWHKIHYPSRAVGQVGLIMVEATAVSLDGRTDPDDLGIWEDGQISGLKELVDMVHEQGAKIGIQLCHGGRKSKIPGKIMAPSAIPYDENSIVPEAMTEEEINEVIAAFKESARRAKQAGFDVLELHAAHGYLINQFLSPLSNKRGDKYGGNPEKRYQFLKEVIHEIHKVWDGALFVRISATDYHPEGCSIDDYIVYGSMMKEQGVHFIDCSSGWIVPPNFSERPGPGYQVPFASQMKKEVQIPTGAVGLITSGLQAEEILVEGHADLIFIGQELLRDPYWPKRAAKELNVSIDAPPSYEYIWNK